MKSEEILSLARECGARRLMAPVKYENLGLMGNEEIITFARRIQAAERERCAVFIERTDLKALPDTWKVPFANALMAYAAAIREQSDE